MRRRDAKRILVQTRYNIKVLLTPTCFEYLNRVFERRKSELQSYCGVTTTFLADLVYLGVVVLW